MNKNEQMDEWKNSRRGWTTGRQVGMNGRRTHNSMNSDPTILLRGVPRQFLHRDQGKLFQLRVRSRFPLHRESIGFRFGSGFPDQSLWVREFLLWTAEDSPIILQHPTEDLLQPFSEGSRDLMGIRTLREARGPEISGGPCLFLRHRGCFGASVRSHHHNPVGPGPVVRLE